MSTAKKINLNGLLTALNRTNLMTYVDTTPRITCFAPSDAAFNRSGSPDVNLSTDSLTQTLKYHNLEGDVGYTSSWQDGQELTTLTGDTVVVKRAEGAWWVNNVKILEANVLTSNGVAHVIDGVSSFNLQCQPSNYLLWSMVSVSRSSVTDMKVGPIFQILSPLNKSISPNSTGTVTPSATDTKKSNATVLKATTTLMLALALPVLYLLL